MNTVRICTIYNRRNAHHQTGRLGCVFFWFDGRVGSLGGREQAVQAEKKGFRFKRNGLPIELESDSISGWNRTKNKKIINPVDKVIYKWYIYKRRKC